MSELQKGTDAKTPPCPRCGGSGDEPGCMYGYEQGCHACQAPVTANPSRQTTPLRAAQLPPGWSPIATAPLDRPVLVYAAPRYDLPGFQAVAQWHENAGWCVCELRDATHWMPLPEPPK